MADVELLPCGVEHELRADAAIIRSWTDVANGPINREALADRLDRYANAAAELTAEIEALRAEVETWKTYARGKDGLWQESVRHAERMAEALKEIRSRSAMNLAMRSDQFELTALLGDIHQISDAALAKENKA